MLQRSYLTGRKIQKMSKINIELIKKLREETGVAIIRIREVLEDVMGDLPADATPQALQAGGSGLIQLGQGYDKGWKAFTVNSKQLTVNSLTHVKVNSWANGWLVSTIHQSPFTNHQTIYIFFWPQLLEWGGMIAGATVLTWLIIRLYLR